MKTIRDIENLEGVRVLVRVDFNVPIRNGVLSDDFRIRDSLPTIEYLRSRGAKIILMSHLESADGNYYTLLPIADYLNKLGHKVVFIKKFNQAHGIIESQMKNGDCVLLENLRSVAGEKSNDSQFGRELASLGDIYVNDAFSASHRSHASIIGVPQLLPSYAGLQMEKEINNLSKVFHPTHPSLFIFGGAKFETKFPILAKFIDSADSIFIGGALANDIFRGEGYEVGHSFVSDTIIDPKILSNKKKLLPIDVLTDKNDIKDPQDISSLDKIMDVGPKTLELLKGKINEAKFILWNGPLGLYEDGYKGPTLELAKMIAQATKNGATTIVGGGDTLAAIAELGIQDKFTFVSSGGGAMLEFLLKGTLVGIEALKESVQK